MLCKREYSARIPMRQMHDARQDLFARKPVQRHVLAHLGPDRRQRLGKRHDMLILGALAHLSKTRVIAILLASAPIAADRLDVSIRKWADPYIRPGRRNGEGAYPLEGLAIGEPDAVRAQISKAMAGLLASNPRSCVRDIAQAHRLGRILRIDDGLRIFCGGKQRLYGGRRRLSLACPSARHRPGVRFVRCRARAPHRPGIAFAVLQPRKRRIELRNHCLFEIVAWETCKSCAGSNARSPCHRRAVAAESIGLCQRQASITNQSLI
jgi:hypothetical protein